jgi:hypothetical protein
VNSEKTSIEQVSANLRELDPSTVSIQVSSSLALEYSEIVIKGQILPQVPYENVTLKASINGGDWNTITTIETNSDGQFLYSWIPPTGTVGIQATWLGNSQLNGATSTQNGITIISYFYVLLLLTLILALVIAILILTIMRRKKIKPAELTSTLYSDNENYL